MNTIDKIRSHAKFLQRSPSTNFILATSLLDLSDRMEEIEQEIADNEPEIDTETLAYTTRLRNGVFSHEKGQITWLKKARRLFKQGMLELRTSVSKSFISNMAVSNMRKALLTLDDIEFLTALTSPEWISNR